MAPSGVGKTTLLRILAGLEQADGGKNTGDWKPLSKKYGFFRNRGWQKN